MTSNRDPNLNLTPSTSAMRSPTKTSLSPKKMPGSAVKVRRLAGASTLENPLFKRADPNKPAPSLGWIDLDTAPQKARQTRSREASPAASRRLRTRRPVTQASRLASYDIDSDESDEKQAEESESEDSDDSDLPITDDVPVLVPKSLKLRNDMGVDSKLRMNWREPRRSAASAADDVSTREDTASKSRPEASNTTNSSNEEAMDEPHDDLSDEFSTPPKLDKLLNKVDRQLDNLISTPSKLSRTPKPPHAPTADMFWDKDFVDDWNDTYGTKMDVSSSKTAKPTKRSTRSPSPTKKTTRSTAQKETKKEFDATKDELAASFLAELDKIITKNKISEMTQSTGGVKIVWSNKLNTTAGRANWQRKTIRTVRDGEPDDIEYQHIASIELAEKVIDDEHRLLNVVAHEFCHLCNFIINGITNNPHGKEFKAWASKVSQVFGHRGIEVTTKHTYDIDFKYVWECTSCLLEYKRHSKSINPEKQRCGRCKSVLMQTRPKPRTPAKPSEYQLFMKTQMKKIKDENPGMQQKDIMKRVGELWAQKSKKGDNSPVEVVEISSDEEGDVTIKEDLVIQHESTVGDEEVGGGYGAQWSDEENENELLAAQLGGLIV